MSIRIPFDIALIVTQKPFILLSVKFLNAQKFQIFVKFLNVQKFPIMRH